MLMKSAKSKIEEGKEAQKRILLMMKYDTKKTLSENFLSNGDLISEQGRKSGMEIKLGSQPNPWVTNANLDREKEINRQNYEIRFREGCGPRGQYYDNAIEPPKTPAGYEGILQCCCYYPVPSSGKENVGSVQGMYIPRNSILQFFDEKGLSDLVDGWYKEWTAEGLEINKDWLINSVSKLFPVGTVQRIKQANGKEYSTWVVRSKRTINGGFETFYFSGYRDSQGNAFPMEVIEDDRNLYQEFIDDWGSIIQWALVLATVVSGFYTGGSSWGLTVELLAELGVGIAVGMREIEKGNTVSGYFTILMGALPALKYSDAFRGLDPKSIDNLSDAFTKSKLTPNSHVSEYVAFYNRLGKTEKETLDKLLRGGDMYGKGKLLGKLSQETAERLPNLLEDGFIKMWKQRPKLFKSIPLFERLWVRELGTNLTTAVASLITQYTCPQCSKANSDELTQEMKDKLDGVYENIPDELKKEMTFLLLTNPEQAQEILDSDEIKDAQNNAKSLIGDYNDNVSKGLFHLFGNAMKNVAEKNTLDWQPTSDIFDSKKMSPQELEKLKKEGWIPKDSLQLFQPYTKLDYINDVYYVLPENKIDTNTIRK